MRVSKIVLVLLMSICLMLTAGCGSTGEDFNTIIAICSGRAQEYIEAGDHEAAIKILEEGIAASDSEELKTMLEQIEADYSEETRDYAAYAGVWQDADSIVSLSIDATQIHIDIVSVSDSQKIAMIDETVPLSDIQDDSVTVSYVDSWNNKGDCTLVFGDDVIECKISNVVPDASALWMVHEGEYTLFNCEKADHADDLAEPQMFDISKYASTVTYWSTEGTDWESGGYALGIYITEESPDNAYFEFSRMQAAPHSRNAVVRAEIPLSEITRNQVSFYFEDDLWGHAGNVTLTFEEESISFVVSDVEYTDVSYPEVWGFQDATGTLVSNPTVYDDLYYTNDENDENVLETPNGLLTVSETDIYMQNEAVLYVSISFEGSVSWSCDSSIISMRWGEFDATNTAPLYITGIQNGTTVLKIFDTKYPEKHIAVNITVSGLDMADTSKASGILASLGMTEQEFKESCIPLNTGSINSKTTAYYVDYEELLRYPNNYIGQHFVICNNSYDYFICPYCKGTGYDRQLGPEWEHSCNGGSSGGFGESSGKYDENGQHLTYQCDTTMLIPESFSLYNEGVSGDGYPLYSLYVRKPYCYIFDMRDDIYSPNIATDAQVTPYLIFYGLSEDGTDLHFGMITCDVSFD